LIRLDNAEKIILSRLYNDYFSGTDTDTSSNELAEITSVPKEVLWAKLTAIKDKGLITFIHQDGFEITTQGIEVIEDAPSIFNANTIVTIELRNTIITNLANRFDRNSQSQRVIIPTFLNVVFLDAIPNPFNPHTSIRLSGFKPNEKLKLKICDSKGKLVRTITDKTTVTGNIKFNWDGKNDSGSALGSGMYVVNISGKSINISKKLVLMR
jgi:hypothetical protein